VTVSAEERWNALDTPWRRAFTLAWEALVAGNIGVGAVVTTSEGEVVSSGRNRVADREAPAGEIAGSSLAHAEMNALATLPFRHPRSLVLTTTLQPCLQCSAAIRMGPIATLRIAGEDPLWHGTHDFGSMNDWLARREPIRSEGPMRDPIGAFAVLLSRVGPWFRDHVDHALRERGESPILDLARVIQDDGSFDRLRQGSVDEALTELWPRLVAVSAERWPSST
jgi:tRNA(adenine34) deaminase